MTSVRLDLAYHGAGFAGWAAQPGERTVQEELEAALGQVLGAPRRLTVAAAPTRACTPGARWRASSTDGEPPAGARAGAQRAHRATTSPSGARGRGRRRLRRPPRRPLADLLLPGARGAGRRARSSAGCRCTGRTASIPALLERCADGPASARTTSPPSPRPRPSTCASSGTCCGPSEARESAGHDAGARGRVELLELWIEADAFMRSMVRVLVGTMLEVGGGRRAARGLRRCWRARRASAAGETAHRPRPLPGGRPLLSGRAGAVAAARPRIDRCARPDHERRRHRGQGAAGPAPGAGRACPASR